MVVYPEKHINIEEVISYVRKSAVSTPIFHNSGDTRLNYGQLVSIMALYIHDTYLLNKAGLKESSGPCLQASGSLTGMNFRKTSFSRKNTRNSVSMNEQAGLLGMICSLISLRCYWENNFGRKKQGKQIM